jgi:negative regulator of flagellin synthesis FlgM
VKITDSIKNAAGLSVGPGPTSQSKGAEKSSNGSTVSDQVHLSALSSQLQALEGQVAGGSVFNTQKVEEIKLAIANGSFHVDSNKVADGLLKTVKDLLETRRG